MSLESTEKVKKPAGCLGEPARSVQPRLPAGVWALGFVSLFMDFSSEMIYSLLPVFLVVGLGAGALTVGAVEGLGDATTSLSKLLSGWLSDRIGKRKLLAISGYGLSALSKPLFALAVSANWVFAARFADRLGKGIRGAPRDALVADLAPQEARGAAYGLRQSLDTVGALVGPLMAVALMVLFHDDFRLVFWCALGPGLIAVAVLALAVHEPQAVKGDIPRRSSLRPMELRSLGLRFWRAVAMGATLGLGRFSGAFLILKAHDTGLPLDLAPVVLVVMNLVYALSVYPVGVLSDRIGRWWLLGSGFLVLAVADLVLAFSTNLPAVMAGIALWGLHMGLTQGLLVALVIDTAPASARGTALGVFHLLMGTAALAASLIAGGLWEYFGGAFTFLVGAGLTGIGLFGFAAVARFPR